ncbi:MULTISPECIES: hypothetical protein [unclassified Methylobacterium]|uniref:DUF6894 family protein n=1 Tax=unclassified Methylobacterium TaxID=2615210 RepID=UPI0006F808E0|nr:MULTISPECIES: hypothetical protein [unclassified Methylobacterium]KQO79353.1 hypothetical protein ASF20_01145 [Methylobacterium sp. Leaf88]KQT70854.1 hypothetical protein ASG51_12155 [Methylobacterium sp. Leaf465]
MARYYFDIHDGRAFVPDPIGQDCVDADHVRREAMRALPEIARDAIPQRGADAQAFKVVVRNTDSAAVYTATLTFSGSWVSPGERPDEPTP